MAEHVSSSADSFSGTLDANGSTTTISPYALVSGEAPPPYDDTSSIASFAHTYDLTPGDPNTLLLHMRASDMVNNAESLPTVIAGQMGAQGTADLGSANFSLIDNPNPMLPLSVLELAVNATGIQSQSTSSVGPNGDSFLNGDASFHSLTVTGALVGGETLTFSGDAAADTVLYKSSTVTITLDEQTLLLPPGATGGAIGPSITTDAIDIQLNHAQFGNPTITSSNQTITGNFDIGQSSAGYSLIPPPHAS
jgi:hypothetical protein